VGPISGRATLSAALDTQRALIGRFLFLATWNCRICRVEILDDAITLSRRAPIAAAAVVTLESSAAELRRFVTCSRKGWHRAGLNLIFLSGG
jgi:hypothetical protein